MMAYIRTVCALGWIHLVVASASMSHPSIALHATFPYAAILQRSHPYENLSLTRSQVQLKPSKGHPARSTMDATDPASIASTEKATVAFQEIGTDYAIHPRRTSFQVPISVMEGADTDASFTTALDESQQVWYLAGKYHPYKTPLSSMCPHKSMGDFTRDDLMEIEVPMACSIWDEIAEVPPLSQPGTRRPFSLEHSESVVVMSNIPRIMDASLVSVLTGRHLSTSVPSTRLLDIPRRVNVAWASVPMYADTYKVAPEIVLEEQLRLYVAGVQEIVREANRRHPGASVRIKLVYTHVENMSMTRFGLPTVPHPLLELATKMLAVKIAGGVNHVLFASRTPEFNMVSILQKMKLIISDVLETDSLHTAALKLLQVRGVPGMLMHGNLLPLSEQAFSNKISPLPAARPNSEGQVLPSAPQARISSTRVSPSELRHRASPNRIHPVDPSVFFQTASPVRSIPSGPMDSGLGFGRMSPPRRPSSPMSARRMPHAESEGEFSIGTSILSCIAPALCLNGSPFFGSFLESPEMKRKDESLLKTSERTADCECPICFDEFEGEHVLVKECQHRFCQTCFQDLEAKSAVPDDQSWFFWKKKLSCPMCRRNVFNQGVKRNARLPSS